MTVTEFYKKWNHRIEPRFEQQGLMISHHDVVDFLNKKFSELEEQGINFHYSQIKWKFGSARVYIEGIDRNTISEWENKINDITNKQ